MSNLSNIVEEEKDDDLHGMDKWKYDLINAAIKYEVFKFGKFQLKSGRISPFFFNVGNFCCGEAMLKLASAYAQEIHESGIEFDVLFGPAYKGIPIVTCTALILKQKYNCNYPYVYDRKEEKDHGEGGTLIGAVDRLMEGARVLILDDVMTGGFAVKAATKLIEKKTKSTVVGIVVCFDREEYFEGEDDNKQAEHRGGEFNRISAFQAFAKNGIKVRSLFKVSNVILYLKQLLSKGETQYDAILNDMNKYREIYGV